MYKVNLDTKIGREIKEIIGENKNIQTIFENIDFCIGFLTSPNEEKQDKNIQIFHENRLQNMQNQTNDYVVIPGCIGTALIQNIEFLLPNGLTDDILEIEVEFGSLAASSRQEKNKITEYEFNSHKQIPEIELITGKKVNLKHSLNTNKELTTIKIGPTSIEIDTVRSTAVYAINVAINSFVDFEIEKKD